MGGTAGDGVIGDYSTPAPSRLAARQAHPPAPGRAGRPTVSGPYPSTPRLLDVLAPLARLPIDIGVAALAQLLAVRLRHAVVAGLVLAGRCKPSSSEERRRPAAGAVRLAAWQRRGRDCDRLFVPSSDVVVLSRDLAPSSSQCSVHRDCPSRRAPRSTPRHPERKRRHVPFQCRRVARVGTPVSGLPGPLQPSTHRPGPAVFRAHRGGVDDEASELPTRRGGGPLVRPAGTPNRQGRRGTRDARRRSWPCGRPRRSRVLTTRDFRVRTPSNVHGDDRRRRLLTRQACCFRPPGSPMPRPRRCRPAAASSPAPFATAPAGRV